MLIPWIFLRYPEHGHFFNSKTFELCSIFANWNRNRWPAWNSDSEYFWRSLALLDHAISLLAIHRSHNLGLSIIIHRKIIIFQRALSCSRCALASASAPVLKERERLRDYSVLVSLLLLFFRVASNIDADLSYLNPNFRKFRNLWNRGQDNFQTIIFLFCKYFENSWVKTNIKFELFSIDHCSLASVNWLNWKPGVWKCTLTAISILIF